MDNKLFLKIYRKSAFVNGGGLFDVREGVVKVIAEKMVDAVPEGATPFEASTALVIFILTMLSSIDATDDEFAEKFMKILTDDVMNTLHFIRK